MLAFLLIFIILVVCICLSTDGLFRLRKISIDGKTMSKVDAILNLTATSGVVLYSILCILAGSKGAVDLGMHTNEQHVHMKLLIIGVLQLIQCGLQSLLINDAFRRQCVNRHQQITKPGQWVSVKKY